ncbi:MAG: DoxX family protein [Pseudolabrys sp.]
MFGKTSNEPKLLFPGLAGFYAAVSDLWYPMIRITVGACLYVHVWPKLHNPSGIAAFLAKAGFVPGTFFAYAAIFLETIGATCVILGLFTRFFAAAIAIELACITFIYMPPQGWGRMEPTFIWGIVMFAIALRGAGPYSLDRKIGKEL